MVFNVRSSHVGHSRLLLEWLIVVTSGVSEPVTLFGGEIDTPLRSWTINSEEELSAWLGRSGFAATRPGNHIPNRAQEHIVTVGCQVDARVALLECVFVALTLDEGRQRPPPNNTNRSHQGTRTRDAGVPSEVPSTSWEGMDEVNLEEVFLSRTPMLKSCPVFFVDVSTIVSVWLYGKKGTEQSWQVMQWREERAWKLFGLIPVMLLHRPRGCGSVGKQELAERANKFGRGQWRELLASSQEVPNHPQAKDDQDIFTEQKRQGRPACNRVQQGQVSWDRQELIGATFGPRKPARHWQSCKGGHRRGFGRSRMR